MAPVTQNINSQLQRNQTASNTGERMGDVDLNTHYQMEDQANVTQMQMNTALVVRPRDGVEIVTIIAHVLDV